MYSSQILHGISNGSFGFTFRVQLNCIYFLLQAFHGRALGSVNLTVGVWWYELFTSRGGKSNAGLTGISKRSFTFIIFLGAARFFVTLALAVYLKIC